MEKEIPPLNGRSFKELVVTNPGVKAYREPVCRNEEAEKYEMDVDSAIITHFFPVLSSWHMSSAQVILLYGQINDNSLNV